MILTPQQADLAPILRDHLTAGDPRALIIEGLSGVGKSTLVQAVLAEMERESTVVTDCSPLNVQLPPDHVAVVDYFHPKQVMCVQRAADGSRQPMVLLAHPRFTSDSGQERVDHSRDLNDAGIPSVIHRLHPMNNEEAASYAGQRHDLVGEFGLGIGGHIRSLLRDPQLDEQRATFLTTSKLHQILGHAHQYNRDPIARVETLLENPISHRLGVELASTQFDSLEKRLARIDSRQGPLLPRHPETLQVYQDILDVRGPECWGIDVFAPDVKPELVAELGLIDGELKKEGFLRRMSTGYFKTWVATQTEIDGAFDDPNWIRRKFEDWMKGDTDKLNSLVHRSEVPAARANPLWVHAGTHGGFKKPDSPLFTYAAEVLLQEHGIPYSSFYRIRNGIVHHVTKDGVRVM